MVRRRACRLAWEQWHMLSTDDLALDSPNYTNDDTASRHSPPCAVPASSLLPEDKCLYVNQRSEASGR